MNLNSLDKDPKRKYQPYAAEPGATGNDKSSGCLDMLALVMLFVLAVML